MSIKPVPKTSFSYGFPSFLPAAFMSADEVRAIGERDLWKDNVRCSLCGEPPDWRGLEKAHILRRGMGGKPKGTTGPTLRLCATCHDHVDENGDVTLAVRRSDGMVCLVDDETGQVTETGVIA